MSRLTVSLGMLPVLSFPLARGITRIGRADDNDIVLTLPDVGDHHARLERDQEDVLLHCIDGERILLNGRAVEEATLSPGDLLEIGGYHLRWIDGEGGAREQENRVTVGLDTEDRFGVEPSHRDTPVDRVIVIGGPDVGLETRLRSSPLVVGRASDCDVELSDDTISWRHLSMERGDNGVRVADLESRNGTLLEGHKIGSALCQAGARIRLGRTTLLLAPAADDDDARTGLAEMVGTSAAMCAAYDRIREAASSHVPVLLLGETGTGKELAARAIHSLSSRHSRRLEPLNCAAVPAEMMEAALFGHTRGAFTGAVEESAGLLLAADGGTLFLDEIAEMPLALQPKLLRVLETGEVPMVGGKTVRSDFRIIAATNRDLTAAMNQRHFRDDLYYRLAVLKVQMPPLRDRPEDIPALVDCFLASAEALTGIPTAGQTRFDDDALDAFRAYPWPGNVRELRNLVLGAVVSAPGGRVDRSRVEGLLPPPQGAGPGKGARSSLAETEQALIRNTLRDTGGNRREAARRLGIAESTLYAKLKRHGLDP